MSLVFGQRALVSPGNAAVSEAGDLNGRIFVSYIANREGIVAARKTYLLPLVIRIWSVIEANRSSEIKNEAPADPAIDCRFI